MQIGLIIINLFSLGRHSRYIRWRRSTDSETSKSGVSDYTPKPSSDPSINSTSLLYADDRTRIHIVREKLTQLLGRFTELFNLFEDEQIYTQNYLDEVDDLMFA